MATNLNPHPVHVRSIWANEWNVNYLRDRWGKDTAASIAGIIGTTASAIIGKAHRLGLPDLGNPVGQPGRYVRDPQPRKPYKRYAVTDAGRGVKQRTGKSGHVGGNNPGGIRIARQSREARPGKPLPLFDRLQPAVNANREDVPAVPVERVDLDQSRLSPSVPVTLEHVGAGRCRWIIGNEGQGKDTLCCGGHTERARVYCASHTARSSTVPAARNIEGLASLATWDPRPAEAAA